MCSEARKAVQVRPPPGGGGMGILGIFCGESAAQGIANQAKINDTIVPSLFHAQP